MLRMRAVAQPKLYPVVRIRMTPLRKNCAITTRKVFHARACVFGVK